MKFLESKKSGLYYYNAKIKKKSADYSFLNSVGNNKALSTRCQLKCADLVKQACELVGRPSHATFLKMIHENQLKNCPITVDAANRALMIYGPDIAALHGKTTQTTRTTPAHVPSKQTRPLPFSILDAHKAVTICIAISFVHGFAILDTVSRNIHFLTAECVTSRLIIKHVLPCLNRVHNLYQAHGFQILMNPFCKC